VACDGDDPAPKDFTGATDDTLWPLDNEFGFVVVDFIGAAQKVLDGAYRRLGQ
jgi:hypothetical protein